MANLTHYEMATELIHGAYRMINTGHIHKAEDYLDQLNETRKMLTAEENEAINHIASQLSERSMS